MHDRTVQIVCNSSYFVSAQPLSSTRTMVENRSRARRSPQVVSFTVQEDTEMFIFPTFPYSLNDAMFLVSVVRRWREFLNGQDSMDWRETVPARGNFGISTSSSGAGQLRQVAAKFATPGFGDRPPRRREFCFAVSCYGAGCGFSSSTRRGLRPGAWVPFHCRVARAGKRGRSVPYL